MLKKTKFTTSIVFQDARIPNLIYTSCTNSSPQEYYDVHTRFLFIVCLLLLLRHTSTGISRLSSDKVIRPKVGNSKCDGVVSSLF